MNNFDSIEYKLLSALIEKNITFATAESCTGGMIGELITSLSGASEVYLGSVVSYANEVKMNVLGVKSETLEKYGAVSEETAAEMAEGAAKLIGSDIAVSVTGVAGPTGGTREKPVGCVCFGVSFSGKTKTVKQLFGEDKSRSEIRRLAADFALDFVYRELLKASHHS